MPPHSNEKVQSTIHTTWMNLTNTTLNKKLVRETTETGKSNFAVTSQAAGHPEGGGVVSGRGRTRASWGLVIVCFLIWVTVTEMCSNCKYLSRITFLYINCTSTKSKKIKSNHKEGQRMP